jgi:hypothetical protein
LINGEEGEGRRGGERREKGEEEGEGEGEEMGGRWVGIWVGRKRELRIDLIFIFLNVNFLKVNKSRTSLYFLGSRS